MKDLLKKILQTLGVCGLIVLIILFSKNAFRNNEEHTLQRYSVVYTDVFDTVTQIVGYAESEEAFNEKTELIHERLQLYHQYYDIYNTYDGIHNIKTINDQAGTGAVKVEKEILELMILGQNMYEITDGQVNIAMGSVLKVWHKYREEGLKYPEQAILPEAELLEEMGLYTDISNLIVNVEDSTVELMQEEMSLDVGSIGKGYAVDLIGEYAKEIGLTHALISVGGNVIAIGDKADGTPWMVGIQNPDLNVEKEYAEAIRVQDMCVVTSGDYQRYYVVDEKKYCHIIDPDTWMPSEYFSSVTVICSDSALADAISTALFNMSYEEGLQLVESLEGVEVLWIFKDGTKMYSPGFSEYMKE